MKLNCYIEHENLDFYILNDQPTTCGKCGARTSFECDENGVQIHQCLYQQCGYKFIAIEDSA